MKENDGEDSDPEYEGTSKHLEDRHPMEEEVSEIISTESEISRSQEERDARNEE